MLTVRDVAAGYGPVRVLHDVSLAVGEREIVCLIGSNGAGKTTLMRCISGTLPTLGGSIHFDGVDLAAIPACDVVTNGVALVPEGRRLFSTMSVRENLLMGAYRRSDRGVATDLAQAYNLFPILGQRRHQAAGTLSGGEQQMCAIARGLMSRPKLLLIDELSLGLGPKIVDLLAVTLRNVRDTFGLAILLVEQDVAVAFDLADRGCLLDDGRIILAGTSSELAKHSLIREAYVGA